MRLKSSIQHITSLTLIMLSVLWDGSAQSVKKPIRIISIRDGLPQSFVSGFVQDADGFVWIGTLNGVARYDGIRFKVFRNDQNDSATISSNVIISMARDVNNNIWIEHGSGQIDVMDPGDEKITRQTAKPLYNNHPLKLVRRGWLGDFEGNMWVVKRGDGILKYDFKANRILHFSKARQDMASDTIRAMMEDKRHRIWVLDEVALSFFDQAQNHFKSIRIPHALDFNRFVDSDAEMVGLFERSSGEIMFGDRNRLIFYNPKTGTLRNKPLPTKPRVGIRSVQTGPEGTEYFEINGSVFRYSDQSGIEEVGEIDNPKHWETPAFLVDRSGLIWLGTNAAGVHQIDLATPLFESKHYQHAFHEDVVQKELRLSLSAISGWPFDAQNFIGSGYLVRSTYDVRGRLWIGLRNKVGYYDEASKKIVLLPKIPDISTDSNMPLGIRGISFAPDGILWTVSDGGFIRYFDASAKKWVVFLDAAVLVKKVGAALNMVDIFADKDKLFLTTANGHGLLIVNRNNKQVIHLTQKTHPSIIPEDLLLGMTADPTRPDLLWMGSYNGLILLDRKKLQTKVFTMREGLPDNTIYSILTDKSGYLWLSTNKGLCRFHPVTHKIQTFLSDDGLPGDEFNRFHHLKLPDGRLAFGGTEGWTIFDPNAMKADTYHPEVAFTNLKINNVNADQHAEIRTGQLNQLKKLTLPYDQNSLAFEFAGLEFNSPKRLRYRYKLEGYDNDWIVSDNTPVASFTKLPPGNYLLRINSSNTTGQWSSNVRKLELQIKSPFWLSWWAYCFYACVLAGIFWVYSQYLANRERLRQEIMQKDREAGQLKELDTLKTKFFSNITHEFRTPLTLILTPAQRLKPTLNGPEQQRWLSAIERNANQLLRLINQLLDLSKLESGNLKINEALGDPGRFLEDLLSSFTHEAEAKGILLVLRKDPDMGNYWFDPDKLEQIVSNLLSNAIKFTPNDGEVQLTLESRGESGVYLEVCDTGIGIPPEKLPYIYDRFYQADDPINNGQLAAGSGIGLSIVKEMVELQKGTLFVKSPMEGSRWRTVFQITLPYRKADAGSMSEASPNFVTHGGVQDFWTPDSIEKNFKGEPEEEAATILLVEDNAELAEFIGDSLAGNHTIIYASNGAEGLKQAIQNVPDLVLSDVLMPVMDGFEFCGKLKKDERTNHIPIILLTARSSFNDRMEGLGIGADDYLTKPFHIQELQLRVGNLLERQRRMRNQLRLKVSNPDQPALANPVDAVSLQDIFIKKLYRIIEERLDDTSFGVEELAEQVSMSRTSLHRKVKTLTGIAPGDILRNYRLKRAAQFLKQGYNSSETAYKTGFDSASYFSKCFREFYHVTPNEFA
ncbi:hybrid sensor histidine kinase/response regulator transcription factor [Dyadobacter arcticus]|uniref:histidine kinase n=1 Tax=Dyadobacter arcticus TaxID=1078754 RepID=A0ABX0ULI4_9BACT|nr:ATP-binding protein [Dyadobacter arcticus]NIJ53772.1 signal transduction histidine kinase/DNA-binding response OmpR family regulator/ligand-binding sensor domain-containing protein [Dyadobacter arcticus]